MPRPPLRRVLFVSYAFPPVGGVGVHRVTKFVKYLPQFGWSSSVLTVLNPSAPLSDDSLCRDIPPGTIVRKARTLEPGYAVKQAVSASSGAGRRGLGGTIKGLLRRLGNVVLQPDAQVLWRPHAFREGLRLLADVPHEVIVATGPPFSSLMLGAALARRSGLPLVLDYRDEWGISNAYWENKQQGAIANALQRRMQHRAVRAAQVLLATTPSSAGALADVARDAGSQARSTYIYNGFDPDDFVATPGAGAGERRDYGHGRGRFRLSFIGTLWNLNTIEPVVRGIELLCAQLPHLAEELELVCAGRRTAEQERLLDRLNELPCRVVRLPFVDHGEAVSLMQEADSLLLLNADRPHTQRIINAKTFEYLASRRPIFVVAPRGDLWDVVRDLPGTVLCEPRAPETIAAALSLELERHRCGVSHAGTHWDIARYERRHLAGELAELLDRTVRDSRAGAAIDRTVSLPLRTEPAG